MIGLAILAIGGVLIWAALTGRADVVIAALQAQLPAGQAPPISGSSSTTNDVNKGTASGSSGADSGSHMGIDPNGNVIVINKPYGSMSDAEKDAANAFAHKIGNVG